LDSPEDLPVLPAFPKIVEFVIDSSGDIAKITILNRILIITSQPGTVHEAERSVVITHPIEVPSAIIQEFNELWRTCGLLA
jgi:hypothetical protein